MAKKITKLKQTAEELTTLFDSLAENYESDRAIIEHVGSNYDANMNLLSTVSSNVTSLSNQIGEQGFEITQNTTDIADLKETSATYKLTYADDKLKLVKTDTAGNSEDVSEINIVSATDVKNSVVETTRITAMTTKVSKNKPGKIYYSVTSTDKSGPTGDITVEWRIDKIKILTETVKQGENSFDLTNRFAIGNKQYSVEANFTDSYGTTGSLRWSVDVIDLYIDDQKFDDTKIFNAATNYRFIVNGNIANKRVIIKLDNSKVYDETISNLDERTYTIPKLTHGSHTLEAYATVVLDEYTTLESEHLFYDMIFVEAGKTTPIIRWVYDENKPLTQYKPVEFKFSVYDPTKETVAVNFYVDNQLINSMSEVSREVQTLTYKPDFSSNKKVKFELKTGSITKTKNIAINALPYNLDPVPGATIDFNPTGRSNTDKDYDKWSQNGYTMTFSEDFDWARGGWKTDENGETYLCIKAKSFVTINYPLFKAVVQEDGVQSDARTTGKNFKFIFKTTDNRQMRDVVISCRKDNIGFEAGTKEAIVYGKNMNAEVQYVEKEKLELEFNIHNSTLQENIAEGTNNLVIGYLSGDPVRAVPYDSESSFDAGDTPITIGCNTCDVHLYRFKCYEEELSQNNIFKNYIADANIADEMIARYERNDILTNGELDYTKLKDLYPDLRILLITCPRFTFDKDDKVKGCIVQHIMGNGDVKHNWIAENVQIKGQGTSSNEYGTSARNFDIKLEKLTDEDYAIRFDDGTLGTKYAMTSLIKEGNKVVQKGSVPVNYFNIKVNVASSENANNACLAQRYHEYNPYVRDVRKNNTEYDIRDTMEFHPCVVFLKELGTDTKYGNQDFPADGQFHFYACGDFGNSKKNHAALGMDTDKYDNYLKAAKEQNTATPSAELPYEMIVEISNNNESACRFKQDPEWAVKAAEIGLDPSEWILPDEDLAPRIVNGVETPRKIWDGDVIEFRYPEDLFDVIENEKKEFSEVEVEAANYILENLKTKVRKLWTWVASTDTSVVDDDNAVDLPSPVTYNEINILGETIYYYKDNKAYRNAKFKHEYEQYFIKDSLLFSYLFTNRFLMIDNRAKNVFLHTLDGEKWDLCFDYDNDTSLGCDNVGTLKYEYYYEDIDKFGAEDVYNAADSVLWTNVRENLFDDLRKLYKNNLFRVGQDVLTQFTNYQKYKPERLEMIDMWRKYIRPYQEGHYAENTATGKIQSFGRYLNMLNGRKIFQRKDFETYRDPYIGSKYCVYDTNNSLSFRAKCSTGTKWSITPYSWLYACYSYDSSGTVTSSARIPAGQKVELTTPELNDTNSYIYYPEWISAVEGLSNLRIRTVNFDKGTRLTKLIFGSEEDGYINEKTEKIDIQIGGATLLEELDVSGFCQYDKETKADVEWSIPTLKNLTNLKKFTAVNSNISSAAFAEGCPLETLKLEKVDTLKAINLKSLTTFSLKDKTKLTGLLAENTTPLLDFNFIKACENITRVRLNTIDWVLNTNDEDVVNRLITNNGVPVAGFNAIGDNIVKSVVMGRIKFNNNVTLKNTEIMDYVNQWGSENLELDYTEARVDYYYTLRLVFEGTVIDTLEVKGGTDLNSLTNFFKQTVQKPSTETHQYTFARWGTEDQFENDVSMNMDFEAQFEESGREYTVIWKKTSSSEDIFYSVVAVYGEDVSCPNIPELNSGSSSSIFLFDGWDKDTSFILGDRDENGHILNTLTVTARWITNQAIDYGTADSLTFNAADIAYIMKNKTLFNNVFLDKDCRIAMDYGFNPFRKNGNKWELTYSNWEDGQMQVITMDRIELDRNNILDTGIKLFEDPNKDWTLFLDFNAIQSGVIASCKNGTSGFQLRYSSISQYIIDMNNNTTYRYNREQDLYHSWSIIRYIASEKKLYIDNPYSTSATTLTFASLPWDASEATLVFGGSNDVNNRNGCIGILHKAIYWPYQLPSHKIEKIVRNPARTIYFDALVPIRNANLEPKDSLYVEFWAAQLVATRPFAAANTSEYWFENSSLKEWLNTTFLNNLSPSWISIISQNSQKLTGTKWDDSRNYLNNDMISDCKIWIPAIYDVHGYVGSSESQGYYYNEADGYNKRAVFTNNFSRLMTYAAPAHPIWSAALKDGHYYTVNSSSTPSYDAKYKNGDLIDCTSWDSYKWVWYDGYAHPVRTYTTRSQYYSSSSYVYCVATSYSYGDYNSKTGNYGIRPVFGLGVRNEAL